MYIACEAPKKHAKRLRSPRSAIPSVEYVKLFSFILVNLNITIFTIVDATNWHIFEF